MKANPLFLTVEHVLAIHERMVREFEGEASVRDQGLLESAVAMPMARFGGKFLHDGIPEMAAAYLFHLCKNHPFVDGNKRTALASAETFLILNRMQLSASNQDVESLTLSLAGGGLSKDDVVEFFRGHARREKRKT